MTTTLISLLTLAMLGAAFDDAPATELRYTGNLQQNRDGSVVKSFSLYCLVEPVDAAYGLAYLVEERGGGGSAWPERYGLVRLNQNLDSADKNRPRLLYTHDGTIYPIEIRLPLFADSDKLASGATWESGKLTYEVLRSRKIQGRDCWEVESKSNLGRAQTLWVAKGTPLVLKAEQRVFIGRGDEFLLTYELEGQQPIDQEQLDRIKKPLETLVALQSDLERGDGNMKPELNERQLETARKVAARLEREAEATPFARLAAVIARDEKSQSRRVEDVTGLQQKYVGQPAAKVDFNLLSGGTLQAKDLADQIVVLHFWEYQGEPLEEPYGQVGYLDYLHNRRRKLGVKVVGVAVDARLSDEARKSQSTRSVKKLRDFMNLNYDVALDDGSLLSKFGDPRSIGAKLPLWVVIAPDGKIAHYHVGYYDIKPDEGLSGLDEVLIEQIRTRRKTEGN